jgi:hypothetical protein
MWMLYNIRKWGIWHHAIHIDDINDPTYKQQTLVKQVKKKQMKFIHFNILVYGLDDLNNLDIVNHL